MKLTRYLLYNPVKAKYSSNELRALAVTVRAPAMFSASVIMFTRKASMAG
jgi:hypothetical protein